MNEIKTPPYSQNSLSDGSVNERDNSDNFVKIPENEIVYTEDFPTTIQNQFSHFKNYFIDAKCLDKYPEHKTPFRLFTFLFFTLWVFNVIHSIGIISNTFRFRNIERVITEHKGNINELYRTKYNFILDTLHECKIDTSYYPPQEPTHEPFI